MSPAIGKDEFLGILAVYNQALWPTSEVLSLAAFGTVCMALFPGPRRDRLACFVLAALWAWTGLVFGCGYLGRLTPFGYFFGALFAVQAGLLVQLGVVQHHVRFWMHTGSRHLAGILLIFYALVAYPALAALLGRVYPETETFGVPTPITMFTIGMLLLTKAPYIRILYAVPLFWCVVGSWFAVQMHLREDLGLLVAAALVLTLTPTEDDPDAAPAAER